MNVNDVQKLIKRGRASAKHRIGKFREILVRRIHTEMNKKSYLEQDKKLFNNQFYYLPIVKNYFSKAIFAKGSTKGSEDDSLRCTLLS